MTAAVGAIAPDAEIIVGNETTTLHGYRDGTPLVLVFLRHLR